MPGVSFYEEGKLGEGGLGPDIGQSHHLFVANLKSVSLESLVRSKLEILFRQQREAQVELDNLYDIVIEQVEKPLIELSLAYKGNQIKTAKMLGINRNTLKKKIDSYGIAKRGRGKHV